MFMTVSARMADLQQVLQQDDQLHPVASPDNVEVGLNCHFLPCCISGAQLDLKKGRPP